MADWIGNWWSEQAGVSSEDGEENIVILIWPGPGGGRTQLNYDQLEHQTVPAI